VTLGEIKELVMRNVSHDSRELRDALTTFANKRQRLIQQMHDWLWEQKEGNVTTTADVATVTLPTDVKRASMFWTQESGDTYYNILPIIPHEDKLVYTRVTQKGKPRAVIIEPSQLIVVPTPDAAYTIYMRYYMQLPDFTKDDDTNELTKNHPELLEIGMTSDAYWMLQEPQDGEAWHGRFVRALQEAIRIDMRRRFEDTAYLVPDSGARTQLRPWYRPTRWWE